MTKLGLLMTVEMTGPQVTEAATAAFQEAYDAAPNAVKAAMAADRELLEILFLAGFHSGVLWFGAAAAQQAEDKLQQAMTASMTGGNA